jgi:hypothetical protein
MPLSKPRAIGLSDDRGKITSTPLGRPTFTLQRMSALGQRKTLPVAGPISAIALIADSGLPSPLFR